MNRAPCSPYHLLVEKAALPPRPESPDRGGLASRDIVVRPTQQGTVYLWTLGLFSTFLLGFKANLAFLLGSIALGCAGVTWVLARRTLRGLQIDRDAPPRTRVGLPTPFTWTVRNPGRRARLGIELEERPVRGAHPVRVVAEMPVVHAGGDASCEAEITFGRRGDIDLGRQDISVASRFPLGLFRAAARLRVPGRLLVRAQEGRVSPLLRRRVRGRRPVEARRRFAPGDDVIYGVREYRDGDDPRRIHWRTSARRGQLAVTEWRTEEGREAVIVLGRGAGAGGSAAVHFERAVSSAATLWRACLADRMHVTLELGDGKAIQSHGDGRGLDRGLDALARVQAQANRKPRTALKRLAAKDGQRAVVYVAAAKTPGIEKELAAAAGRGGSHAVVPAWSRGLGRWIVGLPS